MVDIGTKIRINDLAADGPIKDEVELTRRANIVMYNYLGTIGEMIAASLNENEDDHIETRQILAETFQQTEHLRLLLKMEPTAKFLTVEEK